MEKVAQSAGKAAPAVAVVGALAAAPPVHDLGLAKPATVAERVVHARLDSSVHPARRAAGASHARHAAAAPATRTYSVQPGDTLSGIAERFYGHSGDWRQIYQANRAKVTDPNLIFPGETLRIPAVTATVALSPAGRHHAAPDRRADREWHAHRARHARPGPAGHSSGTQVSSLQGTLGCSGLEQLWVTAGGAQGAAVTAASVAMAESGGDQFAVSPTDDIGYWQINAPSWGALASTDPMTNARAAIQISADGSNWSAWTTFVDGAASGRC